MTDKVQKREETALASPMNYEMPWDEDTDAMVPESLPFLRIFQNDNTRGAPDEASLGQLFNTATGEAMDRFEGILLWVQPGRILWPGEYAPDNQHLCRSRDGIMPDGTGEEPLEGPCLTRDPKTKRWAEVCPMAQWSGTRQNRKPPACDATYALLFWSPENDTCCVFQVARTSIPAYRQLKSLIKRFAPRLSEDGVRGNLRLRIDITTRKEKGGKGTYYVPVFTALPDPLPIEQAQHIQGSIEALVAQMQTMAPTDAANPTDGGGEENDVF